MLKRNAPRAVALAAAMLFGLAALTGPAQAAPKKAPGIPPGVFCIKAPCP